MSIVCPCSSHFSSITRGPSLARSRCPRISRCIRVAKQRAMVRMFSAMGGPWAPLALVRSTSGRSRSPRRRSPSTPAVPACTQRRACAAASASRVAPLVKMTSASGAPATSSSAPLAKVKRTCGKRLAMRSRSAGAIGSALTSTSMGTSMGLQSTAQGDADRPLGPLVSCPLPGPFVR